MAGDHHEYIAPKTDGTFGLKVNWSQLSSQKVATTGHSLNAPAPVNVSPLTAEEMRSKTLRQLWYWREWRKSSPFTSMMPTTIWKQYRHNHFSGKLPTGAFGAHWVMFVATVGFLTGYSHLQGHAFAKNH